MYTAAMGNHSGIKIRKWISWASLVSSVVKNPPANIGDLALILGQGDPLEKEMATYSSVLA